MKTLLFSTVLFIYSTSGCLGQHWLTDFEQAKSEASTHGRSIVLVFQGSDWCAPCMKLDQMIWNSHEFKEYAQEHFVMLKADFPRNKANKLSDDLEQHNKLLAKEYNKQGQFPLVVILDANGKVLGKTGYKNLSVSAYIRHLESILNI